MQASDWHHPCCSGLQVQGTAISPAARNLLYVVLMDLSRLLGDFNYFLLCEKIFWYIIIKILRPCENTEMEGRNYDQKDRFAYKRR